MKAEPRTLPFRVSSATSRICMAAGIPLRQNANKFQPGAAVPSRVSDLICSNTRTPTRRSGTRDQKFYLKGNSYFYVHTESMLRGFLFEPVSFRF